jgi:hypothetical protein
MVQYFFFAYWNLDEACMASKLGEVGAENAATTAL